MREGKRGLRLDWGNSETPSRSEALAQPPTNPTTGASDLDELWEVLVDRTPTGSLHLRHLLRAAHWLPRWTPRASAPGPPPTCAFRNGLPRSWSFDSYDELKGLDWTEYGMTSPLGGGKNRPQPHTAAGGVKRSHQGISLPTTTSPSFTSPAPSPPSELLGLLG